MQPLIALSEQAASINSRPLAPEVQHHARRALIDWYAALLPGCLLSPATNLATVLAASRGGRSVCYVDGSRTDIRTAALLNAVASHTIEFDDIHRDSGYHPGCPTIPAALAVAQERGASMEALLRAVTAGYEVSCRIGMAVQPSHYRMWHTTGTVGTFGAATAAAILLGCGTGQIAHAIATAATMAAGLQQAFRGGGMSKPLHAGHAAEAGCLAALAASAGVTGNPDVLDGPAGFAAATSDGTGRWEIALADLGKRLAITEITFKNHGCCGHIFPALDGLRHLQRKVAFAAVDIEHIRIGGYRATKEVCDRPHVSSEQEARFSTQYCAAILLTRGGVRLDAYRPEYLRSADIKAIMSRVSVELDPDIADVYPARRPARVEVTLRDGRVLEHFQPTRIGDPDAPLSDADLSDKFLELVSPVIGDGPARELLADLWEREELPTQIQPRATMSLTSLRSANLL
ncbi:MmgE/PrpD family protein [Enterovirga sp. CN4-39]|uniref:MmgE/PrpD family protein n=1 Tax=Enterovirga sp. CN4-39 TaxID=3400910 RepID=UPI003C2E5A2D